MSIKPPVGCTDSKDQIGREKCYTDSKNVIRSSCFERDLQNTSFKLNKRILVHDDLTTYVRALSSAWCCRPECRG
jgi:hypothetical protein